jgi:hypothetical protein
MTNGFVYACTIEGVSQSAGLTDKAWTPNPITSIAAAASPATAVRNEMSPVVFAPVSSSQLQTISYSLPCLLLLQGVKKVKLMR